MKDIQEIEREFKKFGEKVERLKQLERELKTLNTQGFESAVQSITGKLKKPQLVDEVAREIEVLRKSIETDGRKRTVLARREVGMSEKYDIQELIGLGGFADVYKATKKDDGRFVAIKRPRLAQSETIETPIFLEEAKLWSQLHHRNIVEVIEYGPEPIPWIAIEYMEGGSLRSKIGRWFPPIKDREGKEKAELPAHFEECISIAIQLCDALGWAHNLGFIHRDIKPENILFDNQNNPKLSDWGLGKRTIELAMNSAQTMQSGIMGTIAYAAPEQVKPEHFGQTGWWTDIYQCGAVLYEMAIGQLPFPGEGIFKMAGNIVETDLVKPSNINPELPKKIDVIVAKCMAKDKENRYQDIYMMKADLESIKESLE